MRNLNPIGTTSWSPAKKWNGLKKLTYSGGGGYLHILALFSAAPCSFDLQTTVSCYNFKLDKDLVHAAATTSLYGRDLIHESLYTLLHFSSQPRFKFLYFFVALLLISSFHSLTLVPLQIATTRRSRRGRYSFPQIVLLTIDPSLKMLRIKQRGIK